MSITVNFLKAFNGDSIHLSYIDDKGKGKNILIDGGTSTTYSFKDKKNGKINDGDLKKLINSLKNKEEQLDLVILTHIDDDHIDGFLKWFSKDKFAHNYIKKIWFNSGRNIKKYFDYKSSKVDAVTFKDNTVLTSVKQGVNFEKYINQKGIWEGQLIKQKDSIQWDEITFRILSPSDLELIKLLENWEDKAPESLSNTSRRNNYEKPLKELINVDVFNEDQSPYNGSSIAFILTYKSINYLFLGDAHPTVIIKGLKEFGYHENNKLKVEFIKLSHHGSKMNTSTELLKIIETDKYIISTNGDLHYHPDKLTIARIVSNNTKAKIYFNYSKLIKKIISDQDRQDFPYVEFLDTKQL